MKAVRVAAMVIIFVVLLIFLVANMVFINVPIGMVGVRTQEYAVFGGKGVKKEDFGPGWHRDLGPIDTWTLFDGTVQTLEMTRDPNRGSRRGRDDIQVQSADGFSVSVDVTIKYRILKGMAHKVFEDTGGGTKYQDVVRNEAKKACVGLFGRMRTEDFYDPMQRREKAVLIHTLLSQSLADNFIEVIDVLIRDVVFDVEYERKILSKKLADQQVKLNQSEAKAAVKRGMTQKTEAETGKLVVIIKEERVARLIEMKARAEREVVKIKADYDRYATEKQADADLEAAKMNAEGDLLVKMAEAEGERLRNEAMQGVGGSTIVALEAARNLNLTDITISTLYIDLLDIDAMATRLGVPVQEKKK